MDEYARRMASSRCDGDHITLQALCDALKVRLASARKRLERRAGSAGRGIDKRKCVGGGEACAVA